MVLRVYLFIKDYMKIIPSEFTKIAWKCFLIAKNKAYLHKHQNIDSEHLLLSIVQNVERVNILLEKNNIHREKLESQLKNLINKKGIMNSKQEKLFIGNSLDKTFLKAFQIKNQLSEVVISTDHIIYGLTYDKNCGELILGDKYAGKKYKCTSGCLIMNKVIRICYS